MQTAATCRNHYPLRRCGVALARLSLPWPGFRYRQTTSHSGESCYLLHQSTGQQRPQLSITGSIECNGLKLPVNDCGYCDGRNVAMPGIGNDAQSGRFGFVLSMRLHLLLTPIRKRDGRLALPRENHCGEPGNSRPDHANGSEDQAISGGYAGECFHTMPGGANNVIRPAGNCRVLTMPGLSGPKRT